NVWLKCENLQPTGSFKIRGMGMAAQRALAENSAQHFVTGSTGNAALALAYAGRQLQRPVTVFLPTTTSAAMQTKIKNEGASIRLEGQDLEAVISAAHQFAAGRDDCYFVHPFDDEIVQTGHATMLPEIKLQIHHRPPDALLCGVGGGGLLAGLIRGLQAFGWTDVPVVAVETHGSNVFQTCRVNGERAPLSTYKTLATSLGSRYLAAHAFNLSTSHPVIPFAVSDPMAANATQLFADDHQAMVEPACGAVLSLLYSGVIRDVLPDLQPSSHIVVILAGGADITVDMLYQYKLKHSNPPTIVKSGSEIYMRLTTDPEAAPAP
ncbi:catabolic L-serine/threonine dehydratase, partial [Tieghemiomyces parasiticus]